MSHNDPRADVARRPLVLQVPGAKDVVVQRDVRYRDGEDGVFDLYKAPDAVTTHLRPVVVFVLGFPDAGMRRFVGCAAKDMESYITWARAIAASGLIAVTYTNSEPARDASLVLQHLREHAGSLGIDPERIGVWSCSGSVANALALLVFHDDIGGVRCALLYYGYTIDLDGADAIASAAGMFRFANPAAGRSVEDLGLLPICLVRAGQDAMPRLNEALDRFAARLLRANRPMTLINADSLPHAFDIMTDTEASRAVIRQTLAFLCAHLLA
jgi:dienelactone hydrolase